MALTRAMLKGMGLTDEQVNAIIEEHTNVTSDLKTKINTYKTDAEKLPNIQKELDDLKKDTSAKDWEKKYNDEHTAYENYKKEISTEKTLSKVKSAYKKLLKGVNISDNHIDAIMKVTDFSKMKLKDDSENLVDADKLTTNIKEEWKGFIPKGAIRKQEVSNPPGGDTDPNDNSAFAKQLEAKYSQNLYGKSKEE